MLGCPHKKWESRRRSRPPAGGLKKAGHSRRQEEFRQRGGGKGRDCSREAASPGKEKNGRGRRSLWGTKVRRSRENVCNKERRRTKKACIQNERSTLSDGKAARPEEAGRCHALNLRGNPQRYRGKGGGILGGRMSSRQTEKEKIGLQRAMDSRGVQIERKRIRSQQGHPVREVKLMLVIRG